MNYHPNFKLSPPSHLRTTDPMPNVVT